MKRMKFHLSSSSALDNPGVSPLLGNRGDEQRQLYNLGGPIQNENVKSLV
ncbi:mCG147920 [Mus musculus]|jgi:hypothetical protein|nr:mCG147920 [Mus musculus]